MTEGKRLLVTCPYCGIGMRAAVMECSVCQVEVRGAFHQTLFEMLPAEDQEFLEQYLLAGFSIKALAERSGMGYTAIRSRLDRLIERYEHLRQGEETKKRILEQVASGEIPASEGADRIAKLQNDSGGGGET